MCRYYLAHTILSIFSYVDNLLFLFNNHAFAILYMYILYIYYTTYFIYIYSIFYKYSQHCLLLVMTSSALFRVALSNIDESFICRVIFFFVCLLFYCLYIKKNFDNDFFFSVIIGAFCKLLISTQSIYCEKYYSIITV